VYVCVCVCVYVFTGKEKRREEKRREEKRREETYIERGNNAGGDILENEKKKKIKKQVSVVATAAFVICIRPKETILVSAQYNIYIISLMICG
jgi:hypothetical protein